jgi:hypothetical protein
MPPVDISAKELFVEHSNRKSWMGSPVTSRSNWANESKTFSVRRPIEVVVLNCWGTAANGTPPASKTSTILAKSASERVSRSALLTTTASTSLLSLSAHKPL